jgi:hypothetical protein
VKRNIIITAAFIVLAACGLQAQDVKFGIRGGLNLPNIMAGGSNTPVSEGYKSRLAAGAGIFTELQVSAGLSFRLGVEYSGQGGVKNGMQALPAMRLVTEMGNSAGMGMNEQQLAALGALAAGMPQYYYADVDNTVKLDYVMIPITAQYGWDMGQSPWRVYVSAGPFVSFALSGKQAAKGTSAMFTDATGTATLWQALPVETQALVASQFPAAAQTLSNAIPFGTTDITGELKSTNFGITGSVGIRYRHGRNYFFVEAGGNYGFIAVQNDDANGTNRIGAASVMAGYAFSLF